MSMPTLHNRLRQCGLRRKNAKTDDDEIFQAIHQDLNGPGCMRQGRKKSFLACKLVPYLVSIVLPGKVEEVKYAYDL